MKLFRVKGLGFRAPKKSFILVKRVESKTCVELTGQQSGRY